MHIGLSLGEATESRPTRHRRKRALRGEVLPLMFGVIWLLISFYPVFYMFISSIRTQEDFFSGANYLPPAHPTLANYLNVLQNDFGTYFTNSVFVTVFSVVPTVIV